MPSFGVIDIGSNAVRMQLSEVQADGSLGILAKQRAAIRLGGAVFDHGTIPEELLDRVAEACAQFAELCRQHNAAGLRAVATSATREAKNGQQLVERLQHRAGVTLEIISGEREAQLLCLAVQTRMPLQEGRALLADLGGGSTEITLVDQGQPTAFASYPIGSVRLLRQHDDDLQALHSTIASHHDSMRALAGDRFDCLVFCGGSAESLIDMARPQGVVQDHDGVDALAVDLLVEWQNRLAAMSKEQRTAGYALTADRADVIVPALAIMSSLATFAGVQHFLVPRVDIRWGVLQEMRAAH